MKKAASFITNKRLHVFIADDDPEDLEFFEMALKEISERVKITTAKNGRELLDFIQIVIPDIIFLDINMPCMNGIDCLAELRQVRHLEHVPIIMYSTATKAEHIDKSYSLGANLYIKKPVYFAAIKEELSRVLSLSLGELMPQPARDKYFIQLQQENVSSRT
jgi:CheY-like chemotaxis protein